MKLIVGLGNPGRTYRYNRHNIGSLLIDRLAKSFGIKIKRDSGTRSFLGRVRMFDEEIILARPLCFMNLAGHSVKLLLDKFGLEAAGNLLVVCDDLDLELGKIRIRKKGSSAGHRGIGSIIKALGSSEFSRLRLGIGRPQAEQKTSRREKNQLVVGHVLSNWKRGEQAQLEEFLEQAAACCETWIISGIDKAMNEFN